MLKIKKINNKKFTLYYCEKKFTNSKTLLSYIDKILVKKNSFIYESVEKGKIRGRYTIFGYDPDLIYDVYNGKFLKNKKKIKIKNPILYIRNQLKFFKFTLPKHMPPMSMMLNGYFGYDSIRYIEKIPDNCKDDLKIPDIKLIRPCKIVIFDNLKNKFFYIFINFNKKKNCDYKKILSDIVSINNNYKEHKKIHKNKLVIKSNTSKKKFKKNVLIAKKHIAKGDIFQVVLSQRFSFKISKSPLEIYKKLRITNPSPFLYFINFNNFQIIGSSPEILVRVRNKKITIRPIAGTRKRGKNKIEDSKLQKELLADKKELSEHLMLLDLGRNDTSKGSIGGSVKVTEQFKIEKYSHVMHIVSNVEGKYNTNLSLIDAMFAGFPAGTVSGAPKIRAMEIIDKLEINKRKLYAGAIGYFSPNNSMDTCIALRTALIKNNKLYIQAGAGIVADSNPEKEYQETVNKAKAIIEAAK